MSGRTVVAAVALAAGVGAAIAWELKPAPAPGPPTVQVDTVFAEQERPDVAKPSLGTKITTARVKPTQTRIAEAPSSAGVKRVEIYCAPTKIFPKDSGNIPRGVATPDSGRTSPAILPDFAGRRQGSRLTLYSTLNDGRRWATEYRVRGDFAWESQGDSVILRGDRFWVRAVRGGKRCAVWGGLGAAGGLLLGTLLHEPAGGALGGAGAGCIAGAF